MVVLEDDNGQRFPIVKFGWFQEYNYFCIKGKQKRKRMDFERLVQQRRSHRLFTNAEIPADDVQKIMRAVLMAPTSMGRRSWQFVVVENKNDLEKLAEAKDAGGKFLKQASLAIVVLGDDMENDCWIEDGSIAAVSMQYQAQELGLGSCWVQMRNRGLSDGTRAEDVVKGILGIPENFRVLCVVAFGYPSDELSPHDEETLRWENVHIGKW